MSKFKVGDKVLLKVVDKLKLGSFSNCKNKIGVVVSVNNRGVYPTSVYFDKLDEIYTFMSNGYWCDDKEHTMYIVGLAQESFKGNI